MHPPVAAPSLRGPVRVRTPPIRNPRPDTPRPSRKPCHGPPERLPPPRAVLHPLAGDRALYEVPPEAPSLCAARFEDRAQDFGIGQAGHCHGILGESLVRPTAIRQGDADNRLRPLIRGGLPARFPAAQGPTGWPPTRDTPGCRRPWRRAIRQPAPRRRRIHARPRTG